MPVGQYLTHVGSLYPMQELINLPHKQLDSWLPCDFSPKDESRSEKINFIMSTYFVAVPLVKYVKGELTRFKVLNQWILFSGGLMLKTRLNLIDLLILCGFSSTLEVYSHDIEY